VLGSPAEAGTAGSRKGKASLMGWGAVGPITAAGSGGVHGRGQPWSVDHRDAGQEGSCHFAPCVQRMWFTPSQQSDLLNNGENAGFKKWPRTKERRRMSAGRARRSGP
jgi:hypothetical protein